MSGVARRRWSSLVVIVVASALVISGCAAVASAGTPQASGLFVHKVDQVPIIDGDASDPQWENVTGVASDRFSLRAVYDGNEIAMLAKMKAPYLTINTTGNWVWQNGAWTRWIDILQEKDLPIRNGYGTEWFSMYWEIEPFGMEQGGCDYTCHNVEGEYVRTSGHIFVNEEGLGGEADQWNILAKHGYGFPQWHDQGWVLGYEGAYQAGPLTFITNDPSDPFAVTGGEITFFGYGKDRIQTVINDPRYQEVENEDIAYCSQCHQAHDEAWIRAQSLHGDAGRMPYRRNGLTAPTYIERNPVNWADAVVLTETEIADGEAVKVASLSPAEIHEIWARYDAINALVPELIQQEPSGSYADIKVAARWADGEWTIELKRAMVTGYEDDVQFDDLTQRYVMSMTAVSGAPYGSEFSTGLDPTALIVYFETP